MKMRASTGVKKMARNSDASSAVTMVMARARKNTAVMPPRNTSGTKTTMGVRVEPISAGVSSVIALRAASSGVWPIERCTMMFSTITMASSITTPMQAARPPSVIRLKLMLKSFMNTMAISVAMGITTAAISVVRQFFRKPSSTSDRQPQADQDALHHARNGFAHQHGLVVENGEVDIGRQGALDIPQFAVDGVGDRPRRCRRAAGAR